MKLGETCDNCGLKVKKEHHIPGKGYVDPCLGILPGVLFACCGHGKGNQMPYLFFENGVRIRMAPDSIVDVDVTRVSQYHRFNDETTAPKKR